MYLQAACEVGFCRDNKTRESSIFPRHEKDEERFIKTLLANKEGTLISLVPEKPDSYSMSRFLGKIALEALASRAVDVVEGLDEIIDKVELDDLRNFVRRGNSQKIPWEFHAREIYPEGKIFHEEGYGNYEILHEYTLLYTEEQNLFFIIALFGVEYAIDMGQTEIIEYKNWLSKNQNKSPLYFEKIKTIF